MAKPTMRTVDVRPNAETLVKPGELVDLVEVTPLTLADRRIYNQLLENAWDAIDKPVTHVISKADLRGSHNSNDRVGESIERLMASIVKVRVTKDGEAAIERVQLLGGNVETARRDGLLEYEIPQRLRKIIKDSTVFARLQREVMFALSSKYALTLYEMIQKRGKLKWRSSERFTLDDLRGILGVPKGKLTSWSNLKLRAIEPAVEEVNALSDYVVAIEPIKTGRRVTHVELRWWPKDGDATAAAERELQFSSVG
ncbi:MAG: replication initiation protein, partial [Pseudomonadota bacterium]